MGHIQLAIIWPLSFQPECGHVRKPRAQPSLTLRQAATYAAVTHGTSVCGLSSLVSIGARSDGLGGDRLVSARDLMACANQCKAPARFWVCAFAQSSSRMAGMVHVPIARYRFDRVRDERRCGELDGCGLRVWVDGCGRNASERLGICGLVGSHWQSV